MKQITVLVLRQDGSQTLETREIPEDYFSETEDPAPEEEPPAQ